MGLKAKLLHLLEVKQTMFNTTKEKACQHFPYKFTGDLLDYISITASLITLFNSSFISTIGNVTIGYVFYSTRHLWQSRHIFTMNLVLLSLVTALLGIPTYFAFLLTFANGNVSCVLGDVSIATYRFCWSMTIVLVSAISYQRFFSVLYPYRYHAQLTLTAHVVIAIVAWFYGILLTIPMVSDIIASGWPALNGLRLASKIVLVAHIVTTVLCYGRMGYIASCHRKMIAHNSRQVEKFCNTKRTSLQLVGILLLSTLPSLASNWTQAKYFIQVEYFTRTIFYTSCFFNLFLYTMRNEDITAVVKRKVRRKVFPHERRVLPHIRSAKFPNDITVTRCR